MDGFTAAPAIELGGKALQPRRVIAACTNLSVSSIDFGAFTQPIPNTFSFKFANAVLTVNCATGTPWAAAANVGSGTGATFIQGGFGGRRMMSGANFLTYGLYRDGGYTTMWGDGTSGSVTVAGTGTGAAQTNTIFGRVEGPIPAPPPGTYTDTITVTLTF